MKKLSQIAQNNLQNFLLSRESDIALDMENFGDLLEVFTEWFKRKPKA